MNEKVRLGWFLAFVLLFSALQAIVPESSVASHGSWTNHTYTVTDPSPCCYAGWSTTGAYNTFDRGVAFFQLRYATGEIIVSRTVTCSGGGCGPKLKTNQYNWSQGGPSKNVRSIGCAKAGSHILSGQSLVWGPCALMPQGTLPSHMHTSGNFT